MNRIHKTALASAVSMAMMAGQAQSAGFALMEKDATGLGQAYANLATGNGESSGLVGNPAAMTQIDGTAISGGINYIQPSFELQPGSASTNALGGTVPGGLGGDAGQSAAIPNTSIVHQLDEKTRVGVALTVPFGLATEYKDGWLGRYHGLESHVEVIEINPAVSFDVTPEWTIGGGLTIQYAEAKLTSAIDGGTVCAVGVATGEITGPAATACGALAPSTVGSDGYVKVEGDDWSVGYNVGLMWQPSGVTRVGVSYRSGVDHELEGEADYTMSVPLNAFPRFSDNPVTAGLDLPPTVAASLTHEFSDTLTGSLGLLWTGWSSFEELRVEQSGSGQDDILTKEKWDDTLRVAVGGEWQFAPRWTLRAGAAYDPTPVPSAEFRTARLPDADRTWASMGLGYEISKQWSVDVGYTHIWMTDSTIDNVTESDSNTLSGQYQGKVDILGLQLNAHF
ncbi:outer membrane protein transport protein [Guyparkeria sp. 1SP6A2]|nr:outer membrane protein transport protein [Guyparkeria sp. 1SP6A2]